VIYAELSSEYSKAMRGLFISYPNDMDAATLYAESLMDLRPWQLWSRDGTPLPDTKEAIGVLESVLKKSPRHIGANHFYIHVMEQSPNPERALACAQMLEHLVPGQGHLLHMPAHIYTRTGRHYESLSSNRRAVAADEDFINVNGNPGIYYMYYLHNLHFVVMEAAFLGRRTEALANADKAYAAALTHSHGEIVDPFLSLPSLVAVRFHLWSSILRLREPPLTAPLARFIWHYARGMAFIAARDYDSVNQELRDMQKLQSDSSRIWLNPIGPNNSRFITEIAMDTVEARVAEGTGRVNVAVDALRHAIEKEEQLDYDEPSDWMIPSREVLGGILLRASRPKEAEYIFNQDLKLNPHNPRSLFGLAEALKSQFKNDTAVRTEFEEAWTSAEVQLSVSDF
jgi:tetratricopeptide (TPR) repeat protein